MSNKVEIEKVSLDDLRDFSQQLLDDIARLESIELKAEFALSTTLIIKVRKYLNIIDNDLVNINQGMYNGNA